MTLNRCRKRFYVRTRFIDILARSLPVMYSPFLGIPGPGDTNLRGCISRVLYHRLVVFTSNTRTTSPKWKYKNYYSEDTTAVMKFRNEDGSAATYAAHISNCPHLKTHNEPIPHIIFAATPATELFSRREAMQFFFIEARRIYLHLAC